MCGLFGFSIYNKAVEDYSELLNALSVGASERGTHATGISYNNGNALTVYKRPLPASKMDFRHLSDVRVITGHTRHATQGNCQNNYNNHPFLAQCGKINFTLAHNGIIYNDDELRRAEQLPASKIKTDSYVMAQLLEKCKKLDFKSLAECTEKLQGYYTFTLLTGKNELYIIKGDSPISIIHFTRLKMYVYASTDEILYQSIIDAGLLPELKKGFFEDIPIKDGQIMKIDPSGQITTGEYNPPDFSGYSFKNWYDYGFSWSDSDDDYITYLKQIATYMGYYPEEIDELLAEGFTTDEIEAYIYGEENIYAE